MAKIDPWGAQEIRDYSHVFKEFGLKEFPEKISKKLNHRFFKRGLIIAHRDFEKILKKIESKKPFINITGIASSGEYHLGHKADIDLFLFFKKLGAKNHFAVTDIDAYCSRPDAKIESLENAKKIAVQNIANLLAFGLSEKDLYVQSKMPARFYEFAFELSKKITKNTFESVYGHVDLGKISAAILQYADILHPQLKEFDGAMPSITGIGLDQDPHARLTRDIAKKLPYNFEVPSFIYFKHQSGLKMGSKMSASHPETAIFLSDKPDVIKKKINNAFTGGKPTADEQRKYGADTSICKVCETLRFHLDDEEKYKQIIEDEQKGKSLCGDTKKFTVEFLTELLSKHQEKVEKNLTKAEKIVLG